MLLASLGLHGLLLFFPVASSEDGAIPPPDFEQDNIAITRIPPSAPPQTLPGAASGTASASTPTAAVGQRGPAAAPAQTGAQIGTQRTASSQATERNRTSSGSARSSARNTQSRQATSNQGSVPNLASGPSSSTATPPTPPPPASVALQPRTFNSEIHQRLLAHAQTLGLPQTQMAQLAQVLVQQYGYSTDNTSGQAYNANLDRWIEAVKQSSGNPNLWNEPLEPSLTVTHYRRVCLEPSPQPAVVGVVVSPQGSPQGEPTLLKSTGYTYLDQVAIQAVKQHDFSPTESQKAYTVNVAIGVEYGTLECLKPYPRPAS